MEDKTEAIAYLALVIGFIALMLSITNATKISKNNNTTKPN